jgi:hypothetical protein
MALDTYANLKTAIAGELDRDDLTDKIDDFIDLAEARHKRDIRIRDMISRESLTVNARYVDLPAGFLEPIAFRLMTTPLTVLTYLSPYEMNRVRQEESGTPTYFTIHDQFEFDVIPSESFTGDFAFYAELTALSDANTSNALLTRAPDVYFYGALLASATHLMHDERLEVWGALYKEARDALTALDRRARVIGPLVSRVAGATP